jgi:hypothetical protein
LDLPVLAALALAHMDDHVLAVDVAHAQPHQFAQAQSGAVERVAQMA